MYPARSLSGWLTRGIMRLALLLGLGAIALSWSTDETDGQRVFLWVMAGALFLIAILGAAETWREVRLIRARGDA
jgi:hypothetical protein